MSTLLSRFTIHPPVSLSAYPRDYREALASDSILPCSPCGWHLLLRHDRRGRATAGFLRSWFWFGDRGRMGVLCRVSWGVNSSHAETCWPPILCLLAPACQPLSLA